MGKDKYFKRVADSSKDTMTVMEVAQYLKLTTITVYKLVKNGELTASQFGGRIRFSRKYIESLGELP